MSSDKPSPPAHAEYQPPHKENVKETFISILIAFVLAFVFRSFVIEAFIIPTGSMAPTLLGAHMRFSNPETGSTWTVGPWDSDQNREPFSIQGTRNPIAISDPISGESLSRSGVPLLSGDRILVEKYLYAIREPERFDVVVFKNPYEPNTNFIKRLIGLPGEDIALIDGDVFTRKRPDGEANTQPGPTSWGGTGWQIARKDARVARAVWQEVFDLSKLPLNYGNGGTMKLPWVGQGTAFKIAEPGTDSAGKPRGVVETTTDKLATLSWNASTPFVAGSPAYGLREHDRTITDRYPYDQIPLQMGGQRSFFPVSDLRIRAGVQPGAAGLAVRMVVQARGHEFVGQVDGGQATVKMRPFGNPDGAWTVLAAAPMALETGKITDVEFWHLDQSLRLFVGGKQVVRGDYDWSPSERIANATGQTLDELLSAPPRIGAENVLANPGLYKPAQVRIELQGATASLHRLGLDRDLYYQPAIYPAGEFALLPAVATHPTTTMRLGADQFMVCGDNSPASQDSRLWPRPEPWVADLMTRRGMTQQIGIVPRDMMLGKAFFVYFPAMLQGGPVPVPDVGRMRFIQ